MSGATAQGTDVRQCEILRKYVSCLYPALLTWNIFHLKEAWNLRSRTSFSEAKISVLASLTRRLLGILTTSTAVF